MRKVGIELEIDYVFITEFNAEWVGSVCNYPSTCATSM